MSFREVKVPTLIFSYIFNEKPVKDYKYDPPPFPTYKRYLWACKNMKRTTFSAIISSLIVEQQKILEWVFRWIIAIFILQGCIN